MADRFFSRLLSTRKARTGRSSAAMTPVRRAAEATADHFFLESLEQRKLFTTISGGGDGVTLSYEFRTGYRDQIIQVNLRGNIVVELIGLAPNTNTPVDMEAPLPVVTDIAQFIPNTNQLTGTTPDLFAIYIAQSDPNASMTIGVVPERFIANPPPHFVQFDGPGPRIRVNPVGGGPTQLITPGLGAAYIGGRSRNTTVDLADAIPVLSISLPTAFGVRPAPNPNVVNSDILSAGVQSAAGQSIGKFYVAGALTGRADFGGSVDQFYAGVLLTGDATGLGTAGSSVTPGPGFGGPTQSGPNFVVAGDLHQLITGNTIGGEMTGTSPTYKSGVAIEVGGRLGGINSPEGVVATVHVRNDSQVPGSGLAQTEIEANTGNIPVTSTITYFDPSGGSPGPAASPTLGEHGPLAIVANDTTATAQFLGTARSTSLRNNDVIQVNGSLNEIFGDGVDNYAVALMAGQTATVQAVSLDGTVTALTIIDPDGVAIASDNSNLNAATLNGAALRFTAKKAGVYYFAVGTRSIASAYQLVVTGVGSIALGGIHAQGSIATLDAGIPDPSDPTVTLPSDSIRVDRGDLGAVYSEGGSVVSASPLYLADGSFGGTTLAYTVTRGNLRAISGVSVGLLNVALQPVSAPELNVPRGGVGLVRSTAGVVAINTAIFNGNGNLFASASTVGSYQLIDAATNFAGNIATRQGVGVLRADSVGTGTFAGRWALNTDESGNDGIFDLIEAQTQFGFGGVGGPGITTGPGGNIRYMRVGSGVAPPVVFRDTYFGGGLPEQTTFSPGKEASLTDDNGTTFRINTDPITNNFASPTQPALLQPGSVSVTTYPIRDKGGVVTVDIRSNPAGGTTRGIRIVSGKVGRASSVEIGNIEIIHQATPDETLDITYDNVTRTFTINDPDNAAGDTSGTSTGVTDNVTLTGKSPIDVFRIEAENNSPTPVRVGIRDIDNRTTGEIVNVFATDINSITAESVATTRSTWGSAVEGRTSFQNALPLTDQRNMIFAVDTGQQGNIVTITSRRGVGALFAQNIGTVIADSDGVRHSGVFEGIVAPMYAISTIVNNPDDGNLGSVSLGQGLAASGTGDFVGGGIYADRQILSVSNAGRDSDIRGDIVASGIDLAEQTAVPDPVTGVITIRNENVIGSVRVRNGSIINAEIMSATIDSSLENTVGLAIVGSSGSAVDIPIPDIGGVRVDGTGGIIGSIIAGRNIGRIAVNGGFGILNSDFESRGDGTIDRIEADGYGIQSTTISGGSNVNVVAARGDGHRVSTASYDADVRYSESRRGQFDPYFGFAPSANTDLNVFLGTTASSPNVRGLTETGSLRNSVILGQRDLGTVTAHRIIGDNPTGLSVTDPTFPMRIAFGNSIGTIKSTDSVSNLSLVGGSLNNLTTGNDVFFSRISITGRIRQLNIGGSLRGTSTVAASGPDGSIDSFIVARGLYSPVNVSTNLTKLQVGKDLGTTVNVGETLNSISVGGSILTGSTVNVGGTIKNLAIRRNLDDNATIRADAIDTQTIGGQVLGDIIIT